MNVIPKGESLLRIKFKHEQSYLIHKNYLLFAEFDTSVRLLIKITFVAYSEPLNLQRKSEHDLKGNNLGGSI